MSEKEDNVVTSFLKKKKAGDLTAVDRKKVFEALHKGAERVGTVASRIDGATDLSGRQESQRTEPHNIRRVTLGVDMKCSSTGKLWEKGSTALKRDGFELCPRCGAVLQRD